MGGSIGKKRKTFSPKALPVSLIYGEKGRGKVGRALRKCYIVHIRFGYIPLEKIGNQ